MIRSSVPSGRACGSRRSRHSRATIALSWSRSSRLAALVRVEHVSSLAQHGGPLAADGAGPGADQGQRQDPAGAPAARRPGRSGRPSSARPGGPRPSRAGRSRSRRVAADGVRDGQHVGGQLVGRVTGPVGRLRALVLPAQVHGDHGAVRRGQRLQHRAGSLPCCRCSRGRAAAGRRSQTPCPGCASRTAKSPRSVVTRCPTGLGTASQRTWGCSRGGSLSTIPQKPKAYSTAESPEVCRHARRCGAGQARRIAGGRSPLAVAVRSCRCPAADGRRRAGLAAASAGGGGAAGRWPWRTRGAGAAGRSGLGRGRGWAGWSPAAGAPSAGRAGLADRTRRTGSARRTRARRGGLAAPGRTSRPASVRRPPLRGRPWSGPGEPPRDRVLPVSPMSSSCSASRPGPGALGPRQDARWPRPGCSAR